MSNDDGIDVIAAVERETAGLFAQADRLVEALAARAGLDAARFRCLAALRRQGALPLRRLATLAGLTEREAGEAVAGMERDGQAILRGTPEGPGQDGPAAGVIVELHPAADRAWLEPALRELREAWFPLTRGRCDDLALVAGLMARSRRLTDLVTMLRHSPDPFTL
ncbi:hypothetical protein ABZT47_29790 [Sphaerisporangium sp. NPDC005289]|uniref:MarR family transcriptional regulator n=1 Tax=Sphaerisporangium rhizosphaerae TaxID=2269375 RepID=A0ABW2P8S8_9ACTN